MLGGYVIWIIGIICDTIFDAGYEYTHCDTVRCEQRLTRGHSIKGQDNYFPWFSLGEDTGFDMIRLSEPYVVAGNTFHYVFEDTDVIDGFEYTYALTAYDSLF